MFENSIRSFAVGFVICSLFALGKHFWVYKSDKAIRFYFVGWHICFVAFYVFCLTLQDGWVYIPGTLILHFIFFKQMKSFEKYLKDDKIVLFYKVLRETKFFLLSATGVANSTTEEHEVIGKELERILLFEGKFKRKFNLLAVTYDANQKLLKCGFIFYSIADYGLFRSRVVLEECYIDSCNQEGMAGVILNYHIPLTITEN